MQHVILLLGAPMLLLAALWPAAQGPAPPRPYSAAGILPEGEGKALVERLCVGCHEPVLVAFKREDEEGWAAIVSDMAARGSKGTKDELDIITAYLAEHFSRKRGFARLEIPGASAEATAGGEPQRVAAGRAIYQAVCLPCHQADGRGRQHVAPSLVGSELVIGPAAMPVRILLHGKRGATNVMPAFGPLMSDDQIAAALTYIRREWGHAASSIDTATVRAIRTMTAGRARPWTADELRQVAGGGRGGAPGK